jgi:hypothetical protein
MSEKETLDLVDMGVASEETKQPPGVSFPDEIGFLFD